MNQNVLSFFVGYFIVMNLIGISFIWLKVRTSIINLKDGIVNLIYFVISVLGGFIGVLLGAEMLGIKQDNKILKRLIPLVIFLEIFIAGYILYVNYL